MNSYSPIDSLERHQARIIRRMMVLSLVLHVGVFLLGTAISPLFPSMQPPPTVFVELTDAPSSEFPEIPGPPLQVATPVRVGPPDASPSPPASPRPAAKENPALRRWLDKLDAGISKVPDAPVARKGGDVGGIPVRERTSEEAAKPGDFLPAGVPGGTAALGKQLEDLEARVRRSGRPGVGIGSETEASMMYGGKGAAAGGGGGIPAWLRDMIRKRVRDSLPELEAVYNEAIRRNPDLRGRLLVRFRIDPSGKVQRAESVEGDFRDPAFVNAVLEKIRRWNFEPTGGLAVDVLYPFIFIAPS